LVRIVKICAALLLAIALCGCSTLRFAYENADSYVRWRMDAYLDVHGEDADWLNDRVDEFHAWHRRNELPKLALLAREADGRFADGISREDFNWGYDAVRQRARESLRHAAQMIAPLLDRLTPEQIRYMERRIAEENRKFQRDYLRGTERERRERRAKQVVDRLEDWVGKLSRAQVKRVREFAERAPLLDELRERDRKRLQADVMRIIRAKEAQKRLAGRVSEWERGRDPAYAAGTETWREHAIAMLVDLDRTLTREQRARVAGNLRRYAEDFEALSGR
jgi:hypothetical protein